ncbi:MAG TPA: FdhF/YdeP family oxidoreductase [Abditibacteriaceae bacterium]|jgi:molybdopterin-dependent oxidoreductase alpha subunit
MKPDNSEAQPQSAARELTREAHTGLEVHPPKTVAGGIPAVASSLKHLMKETGVVRGAKAVRRLNQKGGFDCPGCAWPDPDGHRSHSEYCENGAKAVAEEATTKRVGPEFFARYSLDELAQQSDYWLGKAGRLTHPMLLREGASHYEAVGWDEAFQILAEELNAVAPDETVFYTSGRTSNEAAFLYQLFVRQLGTNNLPDCSNMCHESSGAALGETLGVGKGTVRLSDFEKADLVLILGQNPGTNHPRMLSTLQAAVRAGATIVSINPLAEAGLSRFIHPQEPFTLLGQGTELSTVHLPVRINGDVALLKGVMKEMLALTEESTVDFDRTFIAQYTDRFDEFIEDLRAANFAELEENSGITRAQMRDLAELCLKSKATIACWAMGLTQHRNAVATIREVVNLLLLGGHVGKDGAGVCPVRGHSNVQGDRTMGIWEKMPDAWLDRLGTEFGFTPPRHEGFDTVEAIKAMHDGRAKVFFAMGGNFLSATPDTKFTADALRRCSLTCHVSTKLNRAHLVTGKRALILPCLGRTERDVQKTGEQFVTVENSMSVVHASRGNLEPASEHLLSEPQIVAQMAKATLKNSSVDWDALAANYDLIRDHISRVVPGFENFNERVRAPEGFYLPSAPRERHFNTTTGKARFSVNELGRHELGDGELLMMTIRSHDQYNTTIYGLDDRYRGIENERRVVFLNALDMTEHGLKQGDVVSLVSRADGTERIAPRFVCVPYAIPRRCCATYFPEANVLVPINSVAKTSNTPTSKSVVISIRKE